MTDEEWAPAESEPMETQADDEATDQHAPDLLAEDTWDQDVADDGVDADAADDVGQRGGIGFVRWLVETALLLAAAFLLAQGVRTYVVQPYVIPTGSMEPTIVARDRVLVNRFVYRFGTPSKGDIVVFKDPTGQTPALIKRVIATGGETIDLQGGTVERNGTALDEPYTHDQPSTPGAVALPITVPEGQLWLMGDNRTNSKDSRWLGPQPVAAVAGKAFFVYWPPEHFGPLR